MRGKQENWIDYGTVKRRLKEKEKNRSIMENTLKSYPKKEPPPPGRGSKAVLLLKTMNIWKILDANGDFAERSSKKNEL